MAVKTRGRGTQTEVEVGKEERRSSSAKREGGSRPAINEYAGPPAGGVTGAVLLGPLGLWSEGLARPALVIPT